MCGETREMCLEFCGTPERMGGRCTSERDRFVMCSIAGTADCSSGLGFGFVTACSNDGLSYARCVSMMR
jgi:hypothetical protein